LDHVVQFSDSVPASARAYYQSKIDEIVPRLKKDPTRGEDWYDLAIWYHSANDYKAAGEVWEFLVKVNPKDAVAYDNLGKLYHYSLKDYPKSESYFKKSIAINADSLVPYLELFQLYADTYKTETTLAVDTLEETAKKFPQETDPLTMLGQYYRDKKEYVKARDAYTRAMEVAQTYNNIPLINSIGEELARLPVQAGLPQ
jgi:tetratricopeptide (TPR) repeat protein